MLIRLPTETRRSRPPRRPSRTAPPRRPPPWRQVLDQLAELQAAYGPRLVACAVFGSVGRGTARHDSDIDLLIVTRPLFPATVQPGPGVPRRGGAARVRARARRAGGMLPSRSHPSSRAPRRSRPGAPCFWTWSRTPGSCMTRRASWPGTSTASARGCASWARGGSGGGTPGWLSESFETNGCGIMYATRCVS